MQSKPQLNDSEHGNVNEKRHDCARHQRTRRDDGEEHDVLDLVTAEHLAIVFVARFALFKFFLKSSLLGRNGRLHCKRIFNQRGDVGVLYSFVFHLLHLAHDACINFIDPVRNRHRRLPVRYEDNALFALLLCERFQNHSLVDGIDVARRFVQQNELATL